MSIKLTDKQKIIYDDLSMPEKIAILLIQLGEEATALMFSHMDVDIITEISVMTSTSMCENIRAVASSPSWISKIAIFSGIERSSYIIFCLSVSFIDIKFPYAC